MPIEQGPQSTQLPPDVQQLLSTAGGATATDLITAFVATVLRSRDLERGDLKVMHRAGIALCSERVCPLPRRAQGDGVWLSAGPCLASRLWTCQSVCSAYGTGGFHGHYRGR